MLNFIYLRKRVLPLILAFFVFISHPLGAYATEKVAIFAGGCFWCLEHDLEKLSGVLNVESGYSGGNLVNPTYRNHKGHKEVVRVSFDSEIISYEALVRAYWRNVDPLDNEGQFCDRGDSYRGVIFTNGEDQELAARKSLEYVSKELGLAQTAIQIQIEPQQKFWLAEDYHQNYAELNSLKYNFYRFSCGRDQRLKDVWGKNAGKSYDWNS